MTKRVTVVSVGRILADQVRVEPAEACVVVQQVFTWLQPAPGDAAETVPRFPSLDDLGVTAFGDFEIRAARGPGAQQARPRAAVATELGSLLLRLVSSGRTELAGPAAVCAVIARRTQRPTASDTGPHGAPDALATPEALLGALSPLLPADRTASLATLFARWMRTTDTAHAPAWQAVVGHDDAEPRPTGVLPTSVTIAVPPAADSPPRSGTRRRRRRGRRRRAGLAAVALALLVAAVVWGVMRRDHVRSGPTHGATPRAATRDVTDADTSAAPSTSGAVQTPRRLLDADVTGTVPSSPSFDPRTRGLVFHTGLERTALREAALSDDGRVTAVRTLREDGARALHAQVSPDGTRLAFDSDIDGPRGV